MTYKRLFALLIVVASLCQGCVTIQPVASEGISEQKASRQSNMESESSVPVKSEQKKTPIAPSGAAGEIGAYRLKALDPIVIRFSGIRDQQELALVIDENGEIKLLHLKPIIAAGKTTSELERVIEQAYIDGGIYKTISVNVTMTSKTYFIKGEINAPGQFQLEGGTTLLQAIAASRGYTPYASDKIIIIRNGRNYKYDRDKLEKDPSKDVKIEAGDIIDVKENWY